MEFKPSSHSTWKSSFSHYSATPRAAPPSETKLLGEANLTFICMIFPWKCTQMLFDLWWGLCPHKPVMTWNYHKLKMHWTHLPYCTSCWASQCTGGSQLFPSWPWQLWLSATVQHCQGVAFLPKKRLEFRVQFLLDVYHSHSIVRLKKKS
jgi:hypothetical protein